MWDKALLAAEHNAEMSAIAGKKESQTKSATRNQIFYSEYTDEEILNNCITLPTMNPVVELTGNEIPRDGTDMRTRIMKYFDSLGNNVKTKQFGDVALNKGSIHSDFGHGITHKKFNAYAAIPAVLQNGVVIDDLYKSKQEERIVVAAPITIKDSLYYVGVMLLRDPQTQRLYAHDIVSKKEITFVRPGTMSTTWLANNKGNLHITDILLCALNVKDYNANDNAFEVDGATSQDTRYSVWTDEEPTNVQWGFKLMSVDENGLPHAMFIDAAKPYEYDKWYKADSPILEPLLKLEPGYAYLVDENSNADIGSRRPITRTKNGFKGLPSKKLVNDATDSNKRWMVVDKYADGTVSVHNVGINGSGTISTYAIRPGMRSSLPILTSV